MTTKELGDMIAKITYTSDLPPAQLEHIAILCRDFMQLSYDQGRRDTIPLLNTYDNFDQFFTCIKVTLTLEDADRNP